MACDMTALVSPARGTDIALPAALPDDLGYVRVDECFETMYRGIFAFGDVAALPAMSGKTMTRRFGFSMHCWGREATKPRSANLPKEPGQFGLHPSCRPSAGLPGKTKAADLAARQQFEIPCGVSLLWASNSAPDLRDMSWARSCRVIGFKLGHVV